MIFSKEDVLYISLHLFAQSGYDAVSYGQIAAAMGVTNDALARHVSSKSEIFLQIVSLADGRIRTSAPPPAYIQPISAAVCREKLITFFTALFSFWTSDDIASPFRIILTTEQLRDEQMHQFFLQYIVQEPMKRIQKAFAFLPAEKVITQAVRFYSVMFFYCTLYDGASKKDSVLQQFQKQITLLAEEVIK